LSIAKFFIYFDPIRSARRFLILDSLNGIGIGFYLDSKDFFSYLPPFRPFSSFASFAYLRACARILLLQRPRFGGVLGVWCVVCGGLERFPEKERKRIGVFSSFH